MEEFPVRDIGLGPARPGTFDIGVAGTDPTPADPSPVQDKDYGGGGTVTTGFNNSNLDQPSSDAESWRSLSKQLDTSQAAGSGNIDPSHLNNDAQWLRVFSLVVYGHQTTASTSMTSGVVPSLDAAHPAPTRTVVPFRRIPRPRDIGMAGIDPSPSNPSPQDADYGGGGDKQQQSLPGIELSALRVKFQIQRMTATTPDQLVARIYNMKPETMAKVIEFTRVRVMAGYRYSNYGMLFDGEVVQYRRGKENPVDTYLEILAYDGADIQDGNIDNTLPAGSKESDALKKFNDIRKQINPNFSVAYQDPGLYNRTTIREAVLMGQLRTLERQYMLAHNADHYSDNGQYIMMSRDAYRPGTVVLLAPNTGLVGMPEVTPAGIQFKCLINPKLRLGGMVQINSNLLSGVPYTPGTASKKDANGNVIPGDPTGGYVRNDNMLALPALDTAYTSPTGLYKVIIMNHNGDTRGNPWYTDGICIALNDTGTVAYVNTKASAWIRAAPLAKAGATEQNDPTTPPRRVIRRF